MKSFFYAHLRFGLALGAGALLALILCVQCVRTYLYTDAVLVPQQAQREAERQAGALGAAARSAGVTDPRALSAVMEHALESGSDRAMWMRVFDSDGSVLAQVGKAERPAEVPMDWRERMETHENAGSLASGHLGRQSAGRCAAIAPAATSPPS